MTKSTAAKPAATSKGGKYTFFTSTEYYDSLKKRIDAAGTGDRIVLFTLWLRDDYPKITALVQSLVAAQARGANVMMLIDSFHFLVKGGLTPGPAYFFGSAMHKLPRRLIKRYAVLDHLRAAGVQCYVVNENSRPFTNPFTGRSHIKYTVINDTVFIGGCNLSETHFLDVMVAWQDRQIADWLFDISQSIAQTGHTWKAFGSKDLEIPIDADTTLLIDSGTPGQSIILARAHDIIDTARRQLLITYQYFPYGSTAQHLTNAVKRGVTVRAFYNHPTKHKAPLNIIYGLTAHRVRRSSPIELSRYRLPKTHEYLHAKVLTSDQTGMLSSHNYNASGVEWGTAEMGLVSTDPLFIRTLNETLLRQLDQEMTLEP